MTGRDVVAAIRKNLGAPWREDSYRDTFKGGDPDATVRGIATTVMVTYGMLKRANEAGLNMVIAHEVTYWNDRDETKDLLDDPLYQEKKDYIENNGMIVWRMHDHMHVMRPDYTVVGSLRSIGVAGGENAGVRPGVLTIPEMTLGAFAEQVKRLTGARAVRFVGDPGMKVRKVLLGPGYGTPRITEEADVVIGGEQQEADGGFDDAEYAADAAALGSPKGLVLLGHVISEQPGMEDLGNWLKTFLPDVPIQFVPAEEPFWT
ncbi:MAG: Nif3-like dinuclear metal center hexameric protein [Bryobacterales bacterium]|nr:Nif3-like dinuclear metal center hexameric protein [Acidobacteriota bacterium]MCB9383574.1 Nif3-like dinuclear metal center hexameric protein [Bryobacterales bacterium]